jgi:hypothetical protein
LIWRNVPFAGAVSLGGGKGFGRLPVTAISTTGAISGADSEQARIRWKMHRHSQTEARLRSVIMTKMKIDTGDWIVVCDGRKALILENLGDRMFPNLHTKEVREHPDL